MPEVNVDPAKFREFESFEAFYAWLRENHDTADELWIKVHKVGSGLPSITPKEAIDAALCWGWIDGIRKAYDDKSFLQRYTPRRPRSVWSQVNVDNVARLTAAGLMTEHGLRHVEAAKADGRWERAYSGSKEMEMPEDLLAAIRADPRAQATFERLNAQNRFALAFRVLNLKTAAGRRRRIADPSSVVRESTTRESG